ncbi:MAG UNVERIFIED_CONTAM: hypothetical protein LVQ98_01870 [Rickettsiaceae bacterium]
MYIIEMFLKKVFNYKLFFIKHPIGKKLWKDINGKENTSGWYLSTGNQGGFIK